MTSIIFRNKLIPVSLALFRIIIGWHFLYEGLVKLLDPSWTARSFMEGSHWIFGDLFRWMASNNTCMWIIDNANAYGLTLIGFALILGLFTRFASWSGVALLLMYYLAYPPFGVYNYGTVSEGNYLIVNKNLIELLALIILTLTESGQFFGLDMLRKKKKIIDIQEKSELEKETNSPKSNRRREFLKGLAGMPFLALFAGAFIKNMFETGPDAVSGATIKLDYKQLNDLKGKLPEGKLGSMNVSRMIMGCNLIGGWSHARDLNYTSTLFKAYNTDRKVIETLHLAEQAGINTTFMLNEFYPIFQKYLKLYGGKMQTICQASLPYPVPDQLKDNFFVDIDKAIENGFNLLYIHGAIGDHYVKAGKFDMIYKAIDYIKKQGYQAGVGAHSLETIKACEKEGIPVDFYVKTFHHDKYWSAHPEENREEYEIIHGFSDNHNKFHDNMWDLFPSHTIEFMKQVNKPWIAFKVLAAGAILPKVGFRFAFENGADFICVGMFDFQVVDNINTANEILGSLGKRERQWYS